ncbi:MAG: SDR family NAD(P)-dependent oxidoreductase [Rhizobiaceae bacterium]
MTIFGDFTGKIVLITGAGQGLGRVYAKAYSELGAIPIIADLNHQKAVSVGKEIEASGGQALAIHVDVASEDSVASMANVALERFGQVDIIINNAAIFSTLEMRPFEEISIEEWRRVLDVNITGSFLVARAFVKSMRKKQWGRIVNVSSAAWTMGRQNYLHYTSSKAAIIGMTRSMARELGPDGITVNAVLPGATNTEIERDTVDPEQMKAFLAQRSIPRAESPEDLTGAILFLSSSASEFITGQTLTVDGGHTYG